MNLYLRVLGRRDDGYHLIDTLMVPVSLYDEVEISMLRSRGLGRSHVTVACDHPMVPGGERNLAYRAAALLLKEKGIRRSVHIHIRKRIPVGGGLGGGSSDAAATLKGLDRLLHLRCKQREMLSLASILGADVPFFLSGRPARARGIGQLLNPIDTLPRLWLVILYPGFAVQTRWVYQNLPEKLTKGIKNTSINSFMEDSEAIRHLLINDLERVTIARYPRVGFLKERLVQEGAVGALMSGSGSSVFGIFRGGQGAREALQHLRQEEGVQAFLVRSLS